jgi:hypothetical protein
MEAAGSSETLEPICQTKRSQIPEVNNLHSRWYEDLKSQNSTFTLMTRMIGEPIGIVSFTDL